MNAKVYMFADAFAKAPKDCELATVIEAVRTGRYAAQVARLRELRAVNVEAYQSEKRKLPAFLVSGTAASRTEPLEHSGFLQGDLDKLNGTLEAVRQQMLADTHGAFGFVSPSGDGLKLGLRIDGTRHAESFAAAQAYFRQRYALEIDPAVKDRLRLCFVSHDPDAWTNPDAVALPIPEADAPAAEPPADTSANIGESVDTREQAASNAAPSVVVLPSGSVSISESARALFERIGPSKTLFWRGGALVELVKVDDVEALDVVKPDAFRTRAEKFGYLVAWRTDGNGKPVLKPSKMSLDDARAILAAPGVMPAGLGARDSLRLEAGLCLYGSDIDTATTPVEANISWIMSKRRKADGGFPGAATIQKQLAEGAPRLRVGIQPDGKAPARAHTEITDEAGNRLGEICSGGFGPSAGGPVAMGYVPAAFAAVGTKLKLVVRGKAMDAHVAALPFVPHRYFKG